MFLVVVDGWILSEVSSSDLLSGWRVSVGVDGFLSVSLHRSSCLLCPTNVYG